MKIIKLLLQSYQIQISAYRSKQNVFINMIFVLIRLLLNIIQYCIIVKNTEVVSNDSLLKEIPLAQSYIKDITFLNLRKKNQYMAETLSRINDDTNLIESLRNTNDSSNLASMETEIPEQSFQRLNTKPIYCKSNSIF